MNLEFAKLRFGSSQQRCWLYERQMTKNKIKISNEAVDLRSKNAGGTDRHWDCASMVIWPGDGTSPLQHRALYNLAELSLDI